MSWSIKQTETNAEDIQRLEDAIVVARRAQIILFASLSDDRPHPDKSAYPACMSSDVIRIGAATKEGDPFPGIRAKDADHLFPGVDIPYDFNDRHDLVTGSSVATALAAGLASLLIYCVRAVGTTTRVTRQDIQRMFEGLEKRDEARYPSVLSAFQDLEIERKEGDGKVLEPRDQLQEIVQRLYYY